jgi:hypothetical protein
MMLPELKKPSRLYYAFFTITVVWLLALSFVLVTEHGRINILNQSNDDNQSASAIEALQLRQSDLAQQLNNLSDALIDQQTTTSSGLHELSRSIDERFKAVGELLNRPNPELAAISERLNKLDEAVARLSKIPQHPETAQHHAAPKPAQNTVKPPTLMAPSFVLLGAEMRGGERLLSVVPKSSPILSNARLIRVGETIDGWILQAFGGREAVFQKRGQTKKLALP